MNNYHPWASPRLPMQVSPNMSPLYQLLTADDFKERYLSDAAVSTPRIQSPYSTASLKSNSPHKPSHFLFPENGRYYGHQHYMKMEERRTRNDYQRLVGDWEYFEIFCQDRAFFETVQYPVRHSDHVSLICLRSRKHNTWYFLMHQVIEIVFPERARSSVRLRMEHLKIRDMKVADYHLVHKLKEKGCTKLHTGTLKMIQYVDLMRLIISIRRCERFQTGGSQKSKDAIEEHKQMVDRIVESLKDEERLFDQAFVRRIIFDPAFLRDLYRENEW